MRIILLTVVFSAVYAFEKDITFTVQAGTVECFFQKVKVDHVIDLDYQVLDSTRGGLDISFELTDPVGRVVITEYQKPENAHRHTATLEGDYRFCFDNTFSTFSTKTVFFDLLIEDSSDKDYEEKDDKEMEVGESAESYMMRIQDIIDSINKVAEDMSTVRRLQEIHSAHEARDRNVAEGVCSRIANHSMALIFLMVLVGYTQMTFIKNFFEDTNARRGVERFSEFIPKNILQ